MKSLTTFLTLLCISLITLGQSVTVSGSPSANYGETKTYTASVSGINLSQADVYWYSSPGNTVGDFSASSVDVTWNQSGTQSITLEITTWTNVYSDTHNVTVSAPPVNAPPSPTRTNGLCGSQASVRRSGTPPSGVTWYWQGQNSSGTSTSLGSGEYYYPSSATGGSGYYYIRARNNSSGTWSSASGQSPYVTITPPTPAVPDTYNATNSCSSNTVTLFAESSETDVTHIWYTGSSGPQTVSSTGSSSGFSYTSEVQVTLSSGQNVDYWVSAKRGTCESARKKVTATYTSNTNPGMAPDVGLPQCSGTTFSPSVAGGVGSTFEWYDHPTHGSLLHTGGTYSTVINQPGGGTKTFYVGGTLRNASGCTFPITTRYPVTVTVKPLTGTPTISGGVPSRCQGSGSNTHSVSAAHANSFSWSLTPGAGSINSSTGEVTWNAGFSGTATITVTAHGDCNSTTANKTVTVQPLTGAVSISSGVSTRCQGGGTDTYIASATNETGYNWSINPLDAGSINSSGVVTWNANFSGTATVSVTATGNCNNTSANQSVTVQALTSQVTTPSGPTNRCQGTGTDTYTASASNETGYTWSISPASAGSINNSGLVTWNSSFSGSATITVTANGACNNTSANTTVTVDQSSAGGTIGGSTEKFNIASGTLTLSGKTGNVVKWQYRTTTGWNDITNTTTTHNYSGITETTEYQAIVKSGICDEATSSIATVTILALPTITSGLSNIRPGQSTTLTASAGHSNYQWFKDNVEVQNGTSNQLIVDEPGTYKVVITSSGNATHTTDDMVIGSSLDVSENSVITYTFRKAVTNTNPDAFDYAKEELGINASIYDGLGRPTQSVGLRSSPDGKDVITPVEYDDLGRQTKQYLPYVSTEVGEIYQSNALIDQPNFYQTIKQTNKAYSETKYELSPLNRPLEQGAPGDSWQIGGTNTIKYGYEINGEHEVIAWDNSDLTNLSGTFYPAGELYKNITTDEDGNKTVVYVDKEQQTILKQSQVDANTWASTYYIYDEFNNLRVVLQPESVRQMDQDMTEINGDGTYTWLTEDYTITSSDVNSKFAYVTGVVVTVPDGITLGSNFELRNVNTIVSSQTLDDYAFTYDYDHRNRMTMKKVPGAESVFMVYDQWDRLVLTQDGNQRDASNSSNNKWLFTAYDALNRPVMTGFVNDSRDQTALQTYVEGLNDRYLTFTISAGAGVTHGYQDDAYPLKNIGTGATLGDILTVTYYDNYGFINGSDLTGTNFSAVYTTGDDWHVVPEKNDYVKGQVTGTLTRGEGSDFITSISYYDDRYRPIQIVSENHLGGTDVISNQYDFVGNVRKTQTAHSNGTTTRTIERRFTYDHANRLLDTWHQISEDVRWTDLEEVSANGNELTKTAVQSWSNAGAASVQQIPAGSDGAVKMTMIGTTHEQMLGFSQVNDGPGYTTIDFAIYPAKGRIYVYENGVSRGQVGTYVSGDVLKVKRTGSTITYLKNDAVVYTSAVSSTGSLIVDATIYTQNEEMNDVRITYEEAQIASNSYNELGELIEKKLHADPLLQWGAGGFAQTLNYTYNIRGWLTSINDPNLAGNDLFGMELFYDQTSGLTGQSSLYNGNISAMKWSNYDAKDGAISERAYNFGYDKLNRLKTASHFQDNVASTNYGVQGLNYDLNGNIKSLTRNGSSGSAMDALDYEYTGNQLEWVNDTSGDAEGFDNNGTGTNADYTYDDNGNMTSDANKGITTIKYNHLNLPTAVILSPVEGDSITYLYDAAGIKLQQKVYKAGELEKTTDYVGEFIYENGELQLIQHEEGRIVPKIDKATVFELDGSNLAEFPIGYGVTTSVVSGRVKVEATQNTGSPGVYPLGGSWIQTTPGKKYSFKVKGYREIGDTGYLYSYSDNGNILWPGPQLPFGSANEDWVSAEIIIPAGVTQFLVGVLFNRPAIGDIFHISEVVLEEIGETVNDYQYHLKDHLGNVRLTFSTTPENYTMVETFETGEDNGWKDLHRLTRSNANTTVGGDEVELLQSGQTGAMLFLSVNKGDTLDLSVNANYETAPTGNTFAQTAFSTLFTTFDNSSFGTGEGSSTVQTQFGNAITGPDMGGKDDASTAPRAFLNYIFFDEDMNYKSAGFKQISTAALGVGVHETISLNDRIPEQDGYILMYLSNENQEAVNVHWDDFTVYHGKTNVVSTQDYYPFGLTFNESVRVASREQRFKYNGKEKQDETGWLDYGWRMYQPELGRWHSIDPMADKYHPVSPYTYGLNNPIVFIDPDGRDVDLGNLYEKDEEGNYKNKAQIIAFELFSMSKEGKKFLADRAQKGFKFERQIVNKGGGFEASEAGSLSGEIDVNFKVTDLDNHEATKDLGGGADGLTEAQITDEGKLSIDIHLDAGYSDVSGSLGDNAYNILNKTETIFHEVFIHGYGKEKKFKEGAYDGIVGKVPNNGREEHSREFIRNSPYSQNNMTYNVLRNINNKLKLGYTDDQIWKKLMTHGN